MKSIIKIVFVLLTSVLLLTSCSEKPKTENQNAEKPKDAISYERAKVLQQEYIKTRWVFINEHLNSVNHFKKQGETLVKDDVIKDALDVTFDLETLKQYIAYVEKEAKGKGLKGLGLRVYFGAYAVDDTTPNIKTQGYSTVFFMPTHQVAPKKSDGNNFFYWYKDELIDGVDGLNLGNSGPPPHTL